MSGYLEVKLTIKSTRGFTPWKAWKKQWCILRPPPVKEDGLIIVFHTTLGLASNSQIEIPRNSIVSRTDSRTKNYSFGIFPSSESRKPMILLAGQSESDSQLWMARIRSMLRDKTSIDKYTPQKTNFIVSLIDNNFTNSCGFRGLHGTLQISSEGFQICDSASNDCKMSFNWDHISNVDQCGTDKIIDNNRICIICTNSEFTFGAGQIYIYCQAGKALVKTLRNKISNFSPEVTLRKLNRRISRSEGTLCRMSDMRNGPLTANQRDSGLSSIGPVSSENNSKWDCTSQDSSLRLSMDENGYILKGKIASTLITAGLMLTSPGYKNGITSSTEDCNDDFNQSDEHFKLLQQFHGTPSSIHRRCSGVSVASGIYEEISEQLPECSKLHAKSISVDNTYEALGDCIYGLTRRQSRKVAPPPLPPRYRVNSGRLDSASDSGLDEESLCSTPMQDACDIKWSSIHGSLGSLGSLPPFYNSSQAETSSTHYKYCSEISGKTTSSRINEKLPSSALDVFRKRIKSDSQVSKDQDFKSLGDGDNISCQTGDNVSLTRKKRFDFNVTPSKSISLIKNSKMGRALRKLGGGNLASIKSAAKSCETLDMDNESSAVTRCSKSEENLDFDVMLKAESPNNSFEDVKKYRIDLSTDWCTDQSDENIADLSLLCAENKLKHTYPKDILELLLKGKVDLAERMLKEKAAEDEYIPMSPCGRLVTTAQVPVINSQVLSSMNPVEENYMVMKGV